MSIRSYSGWPAFGGDPADILEIDQLISAYAHSVDANRFEDCAKLFTDEGILELKWQDAKGELHPVNKGAGVRLTGHAERIRFQSKVAGDPPALPRKKNGEGHQLINRIIDVQDATAQVRAYRVGGAMQYEVVVVHTPQGWKFSHMLVIFDQDRSFPAA